MLLKADRGLPSINPTSFAWDICTMTLLPCATGCFPSQTRSHFVFTPVPHGQGFS